jgi:uncharacterized protein (DUF488 family)
VKPGGKRPAASVQSLAVNTVATVGYQSATVASFLEAVTDARIELLVDVRAVAGSRRPGFSKTPLAANLRGAGIDYLHLRGLGTPALARAGRHDEMRAIFRRHLGTREAQAELEALADIVRSGRRVCLLCFEADPAHCHRSLVAKALGELVPIEVRHL